MQHSGAGLQVLYGLFRSLSPSGAAKIIPNPHSMYTEPLIVYLVPKSSSSIFMRVENIFLLISTEVVWFAVRKWLFQCCKWSCLFWTWLPFLTINKLLQCLAFCLNALKLFKFPSVLKYRKLLGPLNYFIYFYLNKSLVKVCLYLNHKFG